MFNAPVSNRVTQPAHQLPAFLERLAPLHQALLIPANYATERSLAPHLEASETALVQIGTNDEGRPIRLVPEAADAWSALRVAAEREGVTLIPISGFRSVDRQCEIIRAKLEAGQLIEDILRYVAAPGFSEHHTGRALDISSPEHIELDEDFARTAAFAWLERHAGRFGFRLSYPRHNTTGIGYEPWHWCWHRTSPRDA